MASGHVRDRLGRQQIGQLASQAKQRYAVQRIEGVPEIRDGTACRACRLPHSAPDVRIDITDDPTGSVFSVYPTRECHPVGIGEVGINLRICDSSFGRCLGPRGHCTRRSRRARDSNHARDFEHWSDIVEDQPCHTIPMETGEKYPDDTAKRRADDDDAPQSCRIHHREYIADVNLRPIVAPLRIGVGTSSSAKIERKDGSSAGQRNMWCESFEIATVAREPREAKHSGVLRITGVLSVVQPETVR